MNRRSFLKGLSAAALVVATPLKYLHEPAYRWVEGSLPSFDEIVSETFRRNAPRIAANITANNAMYSRLTKRR